MLLSYVKLRLFDFVTRIEQFFVLCLRTLADAYQITITLCILRI